MSEITIRPPSTPSEFRECQQVQRRSWGIQEEGYLIPVATMVSLQHCGGLVLGAFLDDGRAVGMSMAFRGKWRNRPCLYSQLTGVDPEFQDRKIGTRLKQVQRDFALSEGDVDLIVWAFDPLHAGNANFNLNRLGATATRYVEDMYGPRTDSLNAGLPTDRLMVEWELGAERRDETIPLKSLPKIIAVDDSSGQELASEVRIDLGDDRLLMEIPAHIGGLRQDSPEAAMNWRSSVRKAFKSYFSQGYRAVSFVTDRAGKRPRRFYVLEREQST